MDRPDDTASGADRHLARVKELEDQGFDFLHASGKATIERLIAHWPSAWGDDLWVLIYGDFDPPEVDLSFPSLGITIQREKLDNTAIRSARCVLGATVAIREKSVEAIVDATRRLNVLLGAWTLVDWGNSAPGWWSYITHARGMGGWISPCDHARIQWAVEGVLNLPPAVRPKVDAALYWVREPRSMWMERHRSDLLRVYVAYWTAFECLVEAVNTLRTPPKVRRDWKQQRIDEVIAGRKGHVRPADIQMLYQRVVNPGFVGKAEHALKTCFGDQAARYANECFRTSPPTDRLYDIRNAISHGEVDAENPDELLRVESRLHQLWMIVWGMFGRLVPFPAPADRTRA